MGRVSEEYTRLSIAIAAADIAGDRKEVARLRLRQQVEVAMTGINDNLRAARAKLDDEVGAALARLGALEAERDRVPAAYFDAERARIVREARFADQEAMECSRSTSARGWRRRATCVRRRRRRSIRPSAWPT
jgi:hypothetical protein